MMIGNQMTRMTIPLAASKEVCQMDKIKIQNVPEYAKEMTYMVIKYRNGEYWFYGAYNDLTKAKHSAALVDGVAIEISKYMLL